MPPFAKGFLTFMIWLGIYAPAYAQQNSSDLLSSTVIDKDTCQLSNYRCLSAKEKNININEIPITITADSAQAQANEHSFYQGDVVIEQGYRTLKADTVTLEQVQEQNIVTAEGNVYFDDGQFAVQSFKMKANLTSEDSEINNAKYKMLCSAGRGEAKKVFKNGKTFYQLEDGSFTTCPEGDNSWRFSTSRIDKNDDEIFADFYNPRFEVFGAPIFYLPYLRIPVEQGRLTGFLYPSVTVNDSNGVEIETPFYWNIHPQLDALITPKYMTKRGLFLTFEPRYLTDFGEGSVIFEYIGNDKEFNNGNKSWGYNLKHSSINNHWQYNIDYAKVSDIGYFNRYTDSRIGSRQDNTLLQTGGISYRDNYWDARLDVRDFQPLNPNTSVYRLMPQLSVNYYAPDVLAGANFKMPTKLTSFTTDNNSKPEALRFHAEPTLTLPYNSPWLSATAEGKLLYTYYDQSNIKGIQGIDGEQLEEEVSRTISSVRFNAMMTLERNDTFFGYAYSQTLEPQIQYLNISNVDQGNIYNPVNYANGGFDSARLQTDYHGLFRSNQYSGIDYINPANQITIGAATRFFDDGYKERFYLAFGQIYYFDKPVELEDSAINFSAWAVEGEINVTDRLFVRASLEYDENVNELQFGNATIEYRQNQFFAQASYRFVSRDYITNTIGSRSLDLISDDGLSQVGLVTGFPLGDKFRVDGQVFYDTTQSMMLENSLSLTYHSDCWTIGIGYNEYLLTRSNINDPAIYDNNISLSFSLLGLGVDGQIGHNTAKGNTLGYRTPFALKN